MIIRAPFNEKFHRKMLRYGRALYQGSGGAVYEVYGDLQVTAADLGMILREFVRFCEDVEVEEGRKVRRGTVLLLKPKKDKVLLIRLSDEEYNTLMEYAEDRGLNISDAVREIILSVLRRGG